MVEVEGKRSYFSGTRIEKLSFSKNRIQGTPCLCEAEWFVGVVMHKTALKLVFTAIGLVSPASAQTKNDVALAQTYLNLLGYNAGVVDGVWGGATERALIAFLERSQIAWDGQLDQNELKLLVDASQGTAGFGAVSTKILEDNFCAAKDAGNDAYATLLFSYRGDIRRLDRDGILSSDEQYFLGETHFVTLNEETGYFLVAGVDELGEPPNETLPTMFAAPNVSPDNLYGHGRDVGLEVQQVNLAGVHEVDLDGDGDDDLVIVDYGEHDVDELKGGSVRVALFDADSGRYAILTIDAPKQSNHRSVVVDVDRDGDLDIVVAGRIHGSDSTARRGFVTVFENDGAGGFVENQRLLPNQQKRWFVDARDFNGDGFADLVLGGWGRVPHLILLDNTISGRSIQIQFPGEDQEILSMTTRDDGEAVNAYFFTTNDYNAFNLYRVVVVEGQQRSAEKIWSADRNNKDFGFAHPSRVYGCGDGVFYFRSWPRSDYFNKENGFRFLTDY
ncbi:peptidoglycan-binding domain-containing protein [Sedimentimonas flavescens]|uniref:peptidoglycan-binding domain-containing protein n=1 Tax=Sedimentimonas flavescens TaxID=2851012 RepID=UPI001C4A0477|nr:peptidoglycan-binding domain-containing protein [Sedimentimonas flavescens]MBW0159659.1 peptidoglycan-binding protein [Sedimentimonas flavescens]